MVMVADILQETPNGIDIILQIRINPNKDGQKWLRNSNRIIQQFAAILFTQCNFHELNHQHSFPLRLHLEHIGKYFRREGVFASVLSLRSKSKERCQVLHFLGFLFKPQSGNCVVLMHSLHLPIFPHVCLAYQKIIKVYFDLALESAGAISYSSATFYYWYIPGNYSRGKRVSILFLSVTCYVVFNYSMHYSQFLILNLFSGCNYIHYYDLMLDTCLNCDKVDNESG